MFLFDRYNSYFCMIFGNSIFKQALDMRDVQRIVQWSAVRRHCVALDNSTKTIVKSQTSAYRSHRDALGIVR